MASRTREVSTLTVALRAAPDSPARTWMLASLERAESYRLTAGDLARIDSYRGEGIDLHQFVGALPAGKVCWYEAEVTAQHGTEVHLGYLADVTPAGVDVGVVGYSPEHRVMIGPIGPTRVTPVEMSRPDCTDAEWRELRAGVGIALRAMLLGCGERMDG